MVRISPVVISVLAWALLSCASPARERYQLGDGDTLPLEKRGALEVQYPDFLGVVFDAGRTEDPHMRRVRDDLERMPADARNFEALHAVAVAYFELNARAQRDLGGEHYLADSFRAAKVVAIPWRAYGEIDDAHLREAILDFFEDAAFGGKPGTRETAPRLARIVGSLAAKEADPTRRARIDSLAERIEALAPGDASKAPVAVEIDAS